MTDLAPAVVDHATNLPIDPNDLIAELAGEIKSNVKVSGSAVSVTPNGKFVLPSGDEVPHLDAVIVAYRYRNSYYDKPFKRGDYSPPLCWAVGPQDNDSLTPNDDSSDLQNDSCTTCPHNQFGSSPTGGKTCQNQIWLAVMAPDPKINDDILILKVSATAIKQVAKHLLNMTESRQHPVKVITRFTADTSKGYAKVQARFIEPNTLWEQHIGFAKSAVKMLEQAPSTVVRSADDAAKLRDSGRAARH